MCGIYHTCATNPPLNADDLIFELQNLLGGVWLRWLLLLLKLLLWLLWLMWVHDDLGAV